MNELQRQHYLSALGIETYMPRWQLPYAGVSILCEMPILAEEAVSDSPVIKNEQQLNQQDLPESKPRIETLINPTQSNSLLTDILEPKKSPIPKSQPVSAADILAQLNVKSAKIDGFSLSIWRPVESLMIIDSRNTKLALPTELLLNNILRSIFSSELIKSQEEILRWPMIENSFTKRTANDARLELQTWISVQHEIRPIKYLWLMGENAAIYFLPEQTSFDATVGKVAKLFDSAINALILPSLNEILKNPILKKEIFAAIRHYTSANL